VPPRNSITLTEKLNIFGAEIARFRTEQGLKQRELMAKLQAAGWDVSSETICKVEQGERTLTDVEFMFILKVLKKDLSDVRASKTTFTVAK
jgi:transcriptional regulator with XRE-family HTH domain